MSNTVLALAEKACDRLDVLCKAAAALFLSIIAVAAATQVAGRYVVGYSPPWIEELIRYSFVWMTMLGAAVLVRSNGNAVIDILVARLQGRARHAHACAVHIAVLACAVVLVVQGLNLIGIVHQQLSPAMRISMAYVYAALPVGGLVIAVQSVNALLRIRQCTRAQAQSGER